MIYLICGATTSFVFFPRLSGGPGRRHQTALDFVGCYFQVALLFFSIIHPSPSSTTSKLDDGWPESEKAVFQAALSMVVVKNSR